MRLFLNSDYCISLVDLSAACRQLLKDEVGVECVDACCALEGADAVL